jgi:hypothetical protein
MCSEAEPLDCHRFSMVSYALKNLNWQIKHILKDGSVIENRVLEEKLLQKNSRLVNKLRRDQIDLPDDLLEFCYRLQNEKIGFKP